MQSRMYIGASMIDPEELGYAVFVIGSSFDCTVKLELRLRCWVLNCVVESWDVLSVLYRIFR